MSLSQSQDFALRLSLLQRAKNGQAARWPRVPCFAAALVVSLGAWAGLIELTLKLFAAFG